MIVLSGSLAPLLARAMGVEPAGSGKVDKSAALIRNWSAADLDESFAKAFGAETRDCDICLVFNGEMALVKYVGKDNLRYIPPGTTHRYLERDPRAFID